VEKCEFYCSCIVTVSEHVNGADIVYCYC